MALRVQMLPPHLGSPQLVSATHDDDFIEKLRSKRWSVAFAPGACRYDGEKPIPGATEHAGGAWRITGPWFVKSRARTFRSLRPQMNVRSSRCFDAPWLNPDSSDAAFIPLVVLNPADGGLPRMAEGLAVLT